MFRAALYKVYRFQRYSMWVKDGGNHLYYLHSHGYVIDSLSVFRGLLDGQPEKR